MNGQMFQIAAIVAAGKKALQMETVIEFSPVKYESSILFLFLPSKNTLQATASNVQEWFECIKKMGLEDIKLFCPFDVEDRRILGFSNTTESAIVCFFKNEEATYFVPYWEFDSVNRMWNITYSEHELNDLSKQKITYGNNKDEFLQTLNEIKDFAIKIQCGGFAKVFETAIKILGENDTGGEQGLSELPPENQALFKAACVADVFGAMGSWNDTPPWMADKMGLSEEYEKLSNKLLRNIRLAILYAINEW